MGANLIRLVLMEEMSGNPTQRRGHVRTGQRPQEKPTLPTPWPWTSSLRTEELNLSCFSAWLWYLFPQPSRLTHVVRMQSAQEFAVSTMTAAPALRLRHGHLPGPPDPGSVPPHGHVPCSPLCWRRGSSSCPGWARRGHHPKRSSSAPGQGPRPVILATAPLAGSKGPTGPTLPGH